MQAKRLGELNGWWAWLFKVGLLLLPVWVSWSVWVTSNVFAAKAFMESSERFTQSDGRELERSWDTRFAAIESRLMVQTEILRRIEESLKNKPE